MLNRLFNTLFGKLFAGFCLVILLTAAGVWMAAYSAQSQQNEDIGRIEWRFIAHKSVDSAVGIYEVAGRDGLISWLRNERLNTNPIVFVLDSSGREISGRKLPDKAYESLEAIRKLTDDPNGPPEKRLPVRTVEIDNEPCEFFAVRTVAFPVRLIPPELHHFPIALTLSLAAFFTLLVSWLLARLYTRSLHTLHGAMRRLPHGALPPPPRAAARACACTPARDLGAFLVVPDGVLGDLQENLRRTQVDVRLSRLGLDERLRIGNGDFARERLIASGGLVGEIRTREVPRPLHVGGGRETVARTAVGMAVRSVATDRGLGKERMLRLRQARSGRTQ